MVMTRERETAMESLETRVADHYSVEHIVDTIKAALEKAGADPKAPTPDDLKPVDEFHTGGQEATDALLDQLEIDRETRVLDIGSGIGGTARHVAGRAGCHVTGVDLTPGYVAAAKDPAEWARFSEEYLELDHHDAYLAAVAEAG